VGGLRSATKRARQFPRRSQGHRGNFATTWKRSGATSPSNERGESFPRPSDVQGQKKRNIGTETRPLRTKEPIFALGEGVSFQPENVIPRRKGASEVLEMTRTIGGELVTRGEPFHLHGSMQLSEKRLRRCRRGGLPSGREGDGVGPSPKREEGRECFLGESGP